MQLNKDDVISDFTKKYHDTYLFANPCSSFDLFHVTLSEKDKITLFNDDLGNFATFFGGTVELNVKYPKTGYFEHEDKIYFIIRNPQRQWKRGINSGTFHILVNGSNLVKKWSTSLVKASFNDPANVAERYEKAKNGEKTLINRDWIYSGNVYFKLRKMPLPLKEYESCILK